MPLFDNNAEKQRKENLRLLEDRRVLFAAKLEKMNFKPERMLFCSCEDGSFTALARHNGKYAVVVGPAFGSDNDFIIDVQDALQVEREDVFEKGTGLNGAFGFGTKGAKGFNLFFTLSDGSVAKMPVVAGRTSWLECPLKKNPLIKTKRRRGDANLIWDLMPIEPGVLSKIENALATYYMA
ncbi:MAG: hypothetical protein J6J78_06750 [Clostridia bacterium]|nr:hypothetical protein [Clostridia bacterium]